MSSSISLSDLADVSSAAMGSLLGDPAALALIQFTLAVAMTMIVQFGHSAIFSGLSLRIFSARSVQSSIDFVAPFSPVSSRVESDTISSMRNFGSVPAQNADQIIASRSSRSSPPFRTSALLRSSAS